ncbi:MAG: efflux RND transporter periplasmic adaptor subunit [Desulfobacteraceae bacterium]|nr:efflux RND transporter periplasmic adaptor subunit [Desulfobacteraceae bacterium]
MTPTDKSGWFPKLRRQARLHAGKALLLFIGFVMGASIFALRSCGAPYEHAAQVQAPEQGKETIWTCAMHPQIRQPEPGQCPICGMDLIPVHARDDQGGASDSDRVVLSERARALAKLRTAPVHRQSDPSAKLRLLGRVEPNETTLKTVTAWTDGRIDRLEVNVTGERVRAGQVVATLFSPEIFSAHQDLFVAKQQVERMQKSPQASRQAASAALDAVRERLRLLGVPDDELARMEQQQRPTRAAAIRTPYTGTVIERLATEGAYVSTGTPLYRIANLSTLWVQLDAYETDLPHLSVGQAVRFAVEALPGEEFEGEVTFIDPTLDVRLRTARVRVQVENRDGRLRPGMFAEAMVTREHRGDQGPLVVPATAPLFTGRRAIVYVEIDTDGGVAYEPRTVRLGPRLGEVYAVVAGLAEGDRVVTRGAFALDADLQIRGGASMMTAGDDREEGLWDGVIDLSPEKRKGLAPVVSSYLSVQLALADDDLARAKEAATMLADAVQRIKLEQPQGAHTIWSEIAGELRGHARHVAMADDLQNARQGFEPLSKAVIQLLVRFGNPLDHPLRLAFCPMAFGNKGALWVQQSADIANAYFGASMLTCGEVRQEVAPGGFLKPPADAASGERRAAPAAGHQH